MRYRKEALSDRFDRGNPIFGDWQGAPRAQAPTEVVATPIGERCLYCEKPVEEGDIGEMMPSWETMEYQPIHRDCLIEWVLGPDWKKTVERMESAKKKRDN